MPRSSGQTTKKTNIFDKLQSSISKTTSKILAQPKILVDEIKAVPVAINSTITEITSDINELTTTAAQIPDRISSKANEISNQITEISTTVQNLPTDVSTTVVTTKNRILSIPSNINKQIVAYRDNVTNKIQTVQSTTKAVIKFPGKVVRNSLKTVKSSIDTFYDIRDKLIPSEAEKLEKLRAEKAKRDQRRKKLVTTYETTKERIYTSIDKINSVVKVVKKIPKKAVEVVEVIQNLPEIVDQTKEDLDNKVTVFGKKVEETKQQVTSTSQYLYRVITLQEAKKAYAEAKVNLKNALLAYDSFKRTLATDPLSLITGKAAKRFQRKVELPSEPVKVAAIKSEPSLVDQINSAVNTTVAVTNIIGSGVVATASFTARVIEIMSTPTDSESQLASRPIKSSSPSKTSSPKPGQWVLSMLKRLIPPAESSSSTTSSSPVKPKDSSKQVYTVIEDIRTITSDADAELDKAVESTFASVVEAIDAKSETTQSVKSKKSMEIFTVIEDIRASSSETESSTKSTMSSAASSEVNKADKITVKESTSSSSSSDIGISSRLVDSVIVKY
jgi:hypothetical protein